MKKLIDGINSIGLGYVVIPFDENADIVLINSPESPQKARVLKARLENRPSTLGVTVKNWKTNLFEVTDLETEKFIHITFSSENLIAKYIFENAVNQDGINTISRVGYILFLAQNPENEKKISTYLKLCEDIEFNYAFYLSVQERAVELFDKDFDNYSMLPITITRALLNLNRQTTS